MGHVMLGELPGPVIERRRYSARPFPSYRYVPGLQPHPRRDPAGHSYERHPALGRHAPWDPEEWRTLDDWLYGVDLFNAFYFWEAHEAWEGLWATAERDSARALLLQGLIQIAAALLKTHMRVFAGAQILSNQGLDKLRRAADMQAQLMGLDVAHVVQQFTTYWVPLGHQLLPIVGADVPALCVSPAPSAAVGWKC